MHLVHTKIQQSLEFHVMWCNSSQLYTSAAYSILVIWLVLFEAGLPKRADNTMYSSYVSPSVLQIHCCPRPMKLKWKVAASCESKLCTASCWLLEMDLKRKNKSDWKKLMKMFCMTRCKSEKEPWEMEHGMYTDKNTSILTLALSSEVEILTSVMWQEAEGCVIGHKGYCCFA